MIVNQIQKGWEIIFHPAHGLLAAKIAYQLSSDKFIKKLQLETIAAIQHHDDHQFSFQKGNYITEIGAPKDFSLIDYTGDEISQQVKDVTESAFKKSCWVGTLISYHCHFLYSNQKVNETLKKYLKTLSKKREDTLDHLGLQKADLLTAYDIMRFCDRMSLILCRNNIPEMHRKVEVITFKDSTCYELWEGEKGNIHVHPWPFQAEAFQLEVETRELKKLHFSSDRDLQKSLEEAAIGCKSWTFIKP